MARKETDGSELHLATPALPHFVLLLVFLCVPASAILVKHVPCEGAGQAPDSQEQYKSILDGKRVAFVGDSVTRY
jgi:hypothetical protein